MADALDPRRRWRDIGGDLEASFDGKVYVDIRLKGAPDSERFFISKAALLKALDLFHPEMAPRVAARWLAAQTTVKETFEIEATPDTMGKFKAFLGFFHYNGGHSGLFGMSFDGDGHERLTVKPEPLPDKKLRKGIHAIGGAGPELELAHDDGTYSALVVDRDKHSYTTDEDGKLYKFEPGSDERVPV